MRITGDDVRRVLVLVLVCIVSAALITDYSRAPTIELQVGDVAPRTVKAPISFSYENHREYEVRRQHAAEAEPPAYRFVPSHDTERKERIHQAFGEARKARIAYLTPPEVPNEEEAAKAKKKREKGVKGKARDKERDEPEAPPTLTAVQRDDLMKGFVAVLGVRIPQEEVATLVDAGFPESAEQLAVDLLHRAMRNYIIQDRSELPEGRRPVRVIEERGVERDEQIVSDLADQVYTPEDARRVISIAQVENSSDKAWAGAAATVARALVRTNLNPEPEWTEQYKQRAMAAVSLDIETVKRGAILFREGDVLTDLDVVKYNKLRESSGDHSVVLELLSIALFLMVLLVPLYQFGASYLQDFRTTIRDVASAGVLIVLVAALARAGVSSAPALADLFGMRGDVSSVWFFIPVAGTAMLVRLLMGVAWTMVFSVAAAAVCGLVMDFQALPVVFFLLSSVAGAGAVEGTSERLSVVKAGLYTGVVNAAAVLLIHFLKLYMLDADLGQTAAMRPVWSMAFAFMGGVLSAFLVLGLVPLFEALGFVTDYRLLELASLNHPLMRQVMLRAPGTYHHSVMVGSLAEAGCEAIGAKALEAKVAAYFHDIGKTLNPAYFIENQKGGVNKHDRLDARRSAQIIISHVVEGGRMAKEAGLPQPIIDNIYMHHGNGLLVYFYKKSKEAASDPDSVNIKDFQYPGPKPNTREAGVIMLADKVEAATRSIKVPTEDAVKDMIQRITSSVLADGQFDECPLTFQEIHTLNEVFLQVLMGVYHQRIEYADTADISGQNPVGGHSAPPAPSTPPAASGTPTAAAEQSGVITLDLERSEKRPWSERDVASSGFDDPDDEDVSDDDTDWESLRHLPRERKH